MGRSIETATNETPPEAPTDARGARSLLARDRRRTRIHRAGGASHVAVDARPRKATTVANCHEPRTRKDNIVNQYQERENEYLIKRQHPDVQKLVKEIRAELRNVDVYLHWAINPEEKDGGAYYCQSVIDHAHMLIDQAHEFRAALRANPPPKEDDDDGEDAA